MKTDNGNRFRNRFSQMMNKFFNIFTICSRQSTSYLIENPSYCNLFLISPPVIRRSNLYLSPRRINPNHLELPFYPTTFTFLDQNNFSHCLIPEMTLVNSACSSHNDAMICEVHHDNDTTCQKEPISISSSFFSTSSSSSSSSNCQSTSTIHQRNSINTIPSATMIDIEMLNNRSDSMEKSSSLTLLSPAPPSAAPACFSYIIRPTTPCIFGGEYYDDDDDDQQMNDDEFFLTAGGIVHSCPNIYELSIDDQRKLQSCDHLIYFDQQTSLLDDDDDRNHLNCYDTELNRYSILPRFQPISSSISTDSFSSELELYKERHAMGLSRQYHNDASPYLSSFLPTTWKSDNYLVFMPFIQHQQSPHPTLFNSMNHGKRSRSFDVPIGQIGSSVVA